MHRSRRAVVMSIAAVGVAALLAACGSSDGLSDQADPGTPDSAGAPSVMPETAPSGTPLGAGEPTPVDTGAEQDSVVQELDMNSPALTQTPGAEATGPADAAGIPADGKPSTPGPSTSTSPEAIPSPRAPEQTNVPDQQIDLAAVPVTVDDVVVTSGAEPEITFQPGLGAPSELLVKKIVQGSGSPVSSTSDVVTVNYVGKALSNGVVFDSSYARGQSAQFPLNQVIPGWTEGLQGARVGDRVLLIIPSDMAYGPQGAPGIAGGETLVFVVDVLDVQAAGR